MSTPVASAAAPTPSMDAAAALIDELIRLGVRHVVLSPGSRSQALALVAADAEQRGILSLHVRIDERVAGFTALGIGRESRVPAAVICTSGTAVANLAPAMLEAHHAAVPLVLLSADRPPELRGIGANQTTRQPGSFAPNVRMDADASVPTAEDSRADEWRSLAREAFRAALGDDVHAAGPVHLNLPLREPLSGDLPAWWPTRASTAQVDADEDLSGALYQGGGGIGVAGDLTVDEPAPFVLDRGVRTVVVAGADAGARAEALAWEGGWPLLAEVVSGARFGRYLVPSYRAILRGQIDDLPGRIERVVVLGHPTLTRELTAVLSRDDLQVVALRGAGEPLNLNGCTVSVSALGVVAGSDADAETVAADRDWLRSWMRAAQRTAVDLSPPAPDGQGLASADPRRRLDAISSEVAVARQPVTREGLVDAVWRASWPHDRLMFGSSRLVRVADDVVPGKKIAVHANRGLAGIDGTISTALGIAIARQDDGGVGVTRVLLGDLAFLHDVGALLAAPTEAPLRVQVIVGNDGGGTIFDGLESGQRATPEIRDRVFYTPQRADLAQLASAYGWTYVRADTRVRLDQALTSPVIGPQLIDVPLPR